jgi:hypothetical protein|tara:strand:- start:386 stop:637 length:252 start_codon:yes stop_codon:yes gene_type:complete
MDWEIFEVLSHFPFDIVFFSLLLYYRFVRKLTWREMLGYPDSNEDESTVNIDGGWQFHPQHVGLLILVIVMFYWLYNYSILAP